MAKRDKNWSNHLIRFASSVRGKAFKWGKTDCLSVSLAAVNSMYPSPKVELPLYESLGSAREFYEGGGQGAVLEALQAAPVAFKEATCGDLVVGVNDDEGLPSVGILLRGVLLSSNRRKGVTLRSISIDEIEEYEIYRPIV